MIPPDGVVKALKHASRMENESPGVLMPQTQQRVSKEKVDVIEIEYEPGGNVQMFPALPPISQKLYHKRQRA